MKQPKNKGFALLTVVLLLGLIFLLIINVLTLAQTETSINSSFSASQKAYYIAESGVAKAVWKIKNTDGWETGFEEGMDWSQNFEESNVFSSRGSLQVDIQNTDQADAVVTSTGYYDLGSGNTAQRIVKARVYKTQSENPLGNIAIYSGNKIYSWGTGLYINNGDLFTNDDFEVHGFSAAIIENTAYAVDLLRAGWLSLINSGVANNARTCSGDINPACGPEPEPIEMPNVDFDSSDPNSWKNRADNVYSYQEFRNMLKNNNPLVVNGITYVTGNVFVKKGQSLEVNGVLIADGNIRIGNDYQFSFSQAKLDVNHTVGEPSGLFSKKRIGFGKWGNKFEVDGVVYAEDRFDFIHLYFGAISANINGALLARNISIYNLWQNMNITFDEEIVNSTMNYTGFSPVVTIEHWEEEY